MNSHRKFKPTKENTEFYCHHCNGYITVGLDMSLNGNHVVKCPKCQHKHYRVIKDGVITDDTWGQWNGPTINYTTSMAYYSNTSSADTTTAGSYFLADSWMNTRTTA